MAFDLFTRLTGFLPAGVKAEKTGRQGRR